MSEAFIYDAVRTPRGKNRGGALHGTKPIDLVVGLIDALRERNPDLDDAAIDDIVLGVVSPVGEQGSDIARTAALVAGLDESVAGVQVNRFCASGLEAVNLAAQKVGRSRIGQATSSRNISWINASTPTASGLFTIGRRSRS